MRSLEQNRRVLSTDMRATRQDVKCRVRQAVRSLLLIGCTLPLLLSPERLSAQTLEEAFVEAYRNNPSLNAARALLRQTNEQAPQARGGWRPTITFTGSAGYTDVKQASNGRTLLNDSSQPRSVGLQASQPVYTFGRVKARVEAADATIESQRAQLFQTEQDTFVSTATAYMAVIRERETLKLRRDNLRSLQEQLVATRERFTINDVTRTDVAQAESSVAAAEANVTRSEASLAQAEASFARVVGFPPRNLEFPDMPAGLPASKSMAIEAAKDGNFTVLSARFAEAAAARQIEAAQSDLLPSVDLVSSLDHSENSSGGDNENFAASISLRLTVPLYQSGVTYSKAREARENHNRLRLTTLDQERSATEGTESAYESLRGNQSQFASLEAQIEAAAIALEGVRNEASVGARTVIDVLDAERTLLNARIRLVQASYDVHVASYRLLAAMGRLTAQDLELPVAYYDYDRHYREVRSRWFGTGTGENGFYGN
ncbi:TolC family outer membrane protein [Nisaea sp.]|uniref:TolC family outer membrane protein n=1 Tax=Nisaea sp. TaxID=2024842 RepID=UPI003B524968